MGVCLIIIGGLSFVDSPKGSWAIGSMLLVWNVFYQFSVSLHLACWFHLGGLRWLFEKYLTLPRLELLRSPL